MAPAKRKRTAAQSTTKKSQKKTATQKAKTQPQVKVDELFSDDNSKCPVVDQWAISANNALKLLVCTSTTATSSGMRR